MGAFIGQIEASPQSLHRIDNGGILPVREMAHQPLTASLLRGGARDPLNVRGESIEAAQSYDDEKQGKYDKLANQENRHGKYGPQRQPEHLASLDFVIGRRKLAATLAARSKGLLSAPECIIWRPVKSVCAVVDAGRRRAGRRAK
jgi:hypothetical protein